MYACVLETGCGFIEGCAHPATRPPISATHPRRLSIRELLCPNLVASGTRKSTSGRSASQCVTNQSCGLGREISNTLTMWHMKHIHVADVPTPAAL